MEAVTEINGFLGERLYTHLLYQGISCPVESVFFYSVLLSCKWKPSVKLVWDKMICTFYKCLSKKSFKITVKELICSHFLGCLGITLLLKVIWLYFLKSVKLIQVIEIISFLEDLTSAAELYFRSPFVEQLLPLYFLVVHLSITDSVKLEIDRKWYLIFHRSLEIL